MGQIELPRWATTRLAVPRQVMGGISFPTCGLGFVSGPVTDLRCSRLLSSWVLVSGFQNTLGDGGQLADEFFIQSLVGTHDGSHLCVAEAGLCAEGVCYGT